MIYTFARPALAPTGIISWVNTKSAEVTTTLIVVASLVVVVLLIITAIRTRGAVGSLVVAAFAGALFLWLVSNIDVVSRMVGSEVAAPVPQVVFEPAWGQLEQAATTGPHGPVHDSGTQV